MDALFPDPDQSYRVVLEPWVGTPLYPPVAVARRQDGNTTVYASWNGATQVVSWKVLAGPAAGRLAPVASAAKSGFETAIGVPQSDTTFQVEAMDANGRVIARSRVFEASG